MNTVTTEQAKAAIDIKFPKLQTISNLDVSLVKKVELAMDHVNEVETLQDLNPSINHFFVGCIITPFLDNLSDEEMKEMFSLMMSNLACRQE